MSEPRNFEEVLRAQDIDPDKLPEEIESKLFLRWLYPIMGAACLVGAVKLNSERMDRPYQPPQVQLAHEAYSRIKSDGGTTRDLSLMYNGLIAARYVTNGKSKAMEYLLQRELKRADTEERRFLATQAQNQLETYHWRDDNGIEKFVIGMGIVGLWFLGVGYHFHRSGRKDQAYLTILEREQQTDSEKIVH